MTTQLENDPPWTMSVPEAARKYFGIQSKSAAYAAARSGLIATIRNNGKILALPRVIEAQLSRNSNAA